MMSVAWTTINEKGEYDDIQVECICRENAADYGFVQRCVDKLIEKASAYDQVIIIGHNAFKADYPIIYKHLCNDKRLAKSN